MTPVNTVSEILWPPKFLEAMRSAQHWVVFTGAGVSAESGIPTFRDALTGLWSNFDPEDLATTEAFLRDPDLVWGWYEWRRAKVLEVAPNPAHQAIAELARHVPRLTLITQNVDDLHERAGSPSVLHLHGSLHHPRCMRCAKALDPPQPLDTSQGEQLLAPPVCVDCGGLIRPGVVWFGEMLPEQALTQAFEAAAQCDLLLSVGTSGVVYPAAQIPQLAARSGAWVIHINPQNLALGSEREFQLTGAAGAILPLLVQQVLAD